MIAVTYQKDSRFVFDWFNFVDLFQECDDNCFFLFCRLLNNMNWQNLLSLKLAVADHHLCMLAKVPNTTPNY